MSCYPILDHRLGVIQFVPARAGRVPLEEGRGSLLRNAE